MEALGLSTQGNFTNLTTKFCFNFCTFFGDGLVLLSNTSALSSYLRAQMQMQMHSPIRFLFLRWASG